MKIERPRRWVIVLALFVCLILMTMVLVDKAVGDSFQKQFSVEFNLSPFQRVAWKPVQMQSANGITTSEVHFIHFGPLSIGRIAPVAHQPVIPIGTNAPSKKG